TTKPADPVDTTKPVDPADTTKPVDPANTTKPAAELVLSKAIKQAEYFIELLPGLSDSDKANYKEKIANATTTTDVIRLQNEAESFSNVKVDAKSTINSLSDLTENEKKTFMDDLAIANDKIKVDEILNNATDKNTALRIPRELAEEKERAINLISELPDLSDVEKTGYKEKVANSTIKNDVVQIQSEAKLFSDVRGEAKATIRGLNDLTEAEKNEFVLQIDTAPDKTVVSEILNKATNKALLITKADATEVIKTLTGLSTAEKAGFISQIDSNQTIDGVIKTKNDAIAQDTANQDEVTKITLKMAKDKVKDFIIKLLNLSVKGKDSYVKLIDEEDTNRIPLVMLYKEKAVVEDSLVSLTNLSPIEKSNFIVKISEANSLEDIHTVKDDILAQDEKNQLAKELVLIKKSASNVIDSLNNLKVTEKEHFKNQIDTANSAEEVDQINQTATKQNDFNKEAASMGVLTVAKESAKISIELLDDLNATEKATFEERVNQARLNEEILQILNEANAQDLENRELKNLPNLKRHITNVINALGNLSDDEKLEFITQVGQANLPSEVKNIETAANDKDKVNKAKHDLESEKNEAEQVVNVLASLSDSEKQEFINQINSAKTSERISEIQQQATEQNGIQKEAKDLLNAKNDAKNTINTTLVALTAVEKQDFINQINQIKVIKDIKPILDAAQKQNETQKEIKQLLEEKDSATLLIGSLTELNELEKEAFLAKVQEAKILGEVIQIQNDVKDLSAARPLAREAISALSGLNEIEKESIKQSVTNAKTAVEVKQLQSDAEVFSDARIAAITEINTFEDLTNDEKKDFLDQVNKAPNKEAVIAVQSVATDKNNEKRIPRELVEAKADSVAFIDTLKELSNAEKDVFKKDLVNGSSLSIIDNIRTNAQTLSDTRSDVKTKINMLSDLTEDQKKEFLARVDNTFEVSNIKSILAEATIKNTNTIITNALIRAKEETNSIISTLSELSEREKESFKERINEAKTTPEVLAIQTEAQKFSNFRGTVK
ncbi:TPA: hypothetical protein IQC34_002723, partial [Listeria monocytogenes]|nr:hypothetical protein [Listeria monocytogenes]